VSTPDWRQSPPPDGHAIRGGGLDLTCVAETDPAAWAGGPDVPVRVKATRDDGTVVVEGVINLWVTDKK
jgi:hypothetical protein